MANCMMPLAALRSHAVAESRKGRDASSEMPSKAPGDSVCIY